MSAFDKEYFFILMPEDESLPFMTPDKDTVTKQYDWEIMPAGLKPLIFYNGVLDFQKGKKIKPISSPPEVLFNGSNLVVIERIADELAELDIPDLAIQPAIYIDHKDDWHENYWFLTFTTRFDCWDRKNSRYDPDPVGPKPPLRVVHTYSIDNLQPMYGVYTYSFNESLLRKTPLKKRRLFKIGGTTDGFVVVHKSVADLFRVKWVDVVPIADYGVSYP
ncbi:MAG: hypothetical protein FWE78_00410 [Methanimicrococcus sp.]|nr:hypothetical protein [Methanimicrococcus sp.]